MEQTQSHPYINMTLIYLQFLYDRESQSSEIIHNSEHICSNVLCMLTPVKHNPSKNCLRTANLNQLPHFTDEES